MRLTDTLEKGLSFTSNVSISTHTKVHPNTEKHTETQTKGSENLDPNARASVS